MCGRYYVDQSMVGEIESLVREVDEKIQKERSRDICPSQTAVVITGRKPYLRAEEMIWGFPQYQKKGLLINARAETALERKIFRDSVLHRRCIIPAKHFYEWDAQKERVTFYRKDQSMLFMAGFYNWFQEEERFIILTTEANASVSPVHSRMPLLLEKNELEDWIYEDTFLEFVLHKTPMLLERQQEYEQQSLFSRDFQ